MILIALYYAYIPVPSYGPTKSIPGSRETETGTEARGVIGDKERLEGRDDEGECPDSSHDNVVKKFVVF